VEAHPAHNQSSFWHENFYLPLPGVGFLFPVKVNKKDVYFYPRANDSCVDLEKQEGNPCRFQRS